MAIEVSVEDIRDLCPTALPDQVIQDLICTVQDRIGACLESSYPECTAESIFKYSVCHFIQMMSPGEITSEKAPNGASTSYKSQGAGDGLSSTAMGRLVVSMDTAGCTSNLVNDSFMFRSVGNPARPV